LPFYRYIAFCRELFISCRPSMAARAIEPNRQLCGRRVSGVEQSPAEVSFA
jgi:hypothetical protein